MSGGKCPGGKCLGGICPWGKCPGGKCPGGYILEPHRDNYPLGTLPPPSLTHQDNYPHRTITPVEKLPPRAITPIARTTTPMANYPIGKLSGIISTALTSMTRKSDEYFRVVGIQEKKEGDISS